MVAVEYLLKTKKLPGSTAANTTLTFESASIALVPSPGPGDWLSTITLIFPLLISSI